MENYEEIILKQGQEKIDYDEIRQFYEDIIFKIYNEIDEKNPSHNRNVDYSDEYLDAYSYFQKAEWRLSDIRRLKEYHNEDDFKYYALEHLGDARNRIESYLNDTDIKFSDEIYEYTRYDKIINERMEVTLDPLFLEKFKKYQKILYREGEVEHLQYYINSIKNHTGYLKQQLESNRFRYIDIENLTETVKLLEKIEKDLVIELKD